MGYNFPAAFSNFAILFVVVSQFEVLREYDNETDIV